MAAIAILTAICATAMLFLGCFFVALCKNTCNRYLVHLLRFENTGDWELENTNEPDHSPASLRLCVVIAFTMLLNPLKALLQISRH